MFGWLFGPLVVGLSSQFVVTFAHSDGWTHRFHGPIKMGVTEGCDNGEKNIEIDWDPRSTEENTCLQERFSPNLDTVNHEECTTDVDDPIHICMDQAIQYKDSIPTSGRHRPVWPVYGQYRYIPPQRWLHSLEHGAAVFLYHPCAEQGEIELLMDLAKTCLRRHIITPYKKLSQETPFAVVTYGCKLIMGRVDPEQVQMFLMQHALDAPEAKTTRDGEYSAGLIQKAETVTDFEDSVVCPKFQFEIDSSM